MHLKNEEKGHLQPFSCYKKLIRTCIHSNDETNEYVKVDFFISYIVKDTFKIEFNEKSLKFVFQTKNLSFINLHGHEGTSLNKLKLNGKFNNEDINHIKSQTTKTNKPINSLDQKLPYFIYKIDKLFDKIIPEKCEFNLTTSILQLKLRKKNPVEWNNFEFNENEMCLNFLQNVPNTEKNFKQCNSKIGKTLTDQNVKNNLNKLYHTEINKTISQLKKADISMVEKDEKEKEIEKVDSNIKENLTDKKYSNVQEKLIDLFDFNVKEKQVVKIDSNEIEKPLNKVDLKVNGKTIDEINSLEKKDSNEQFDSSEDRNLDEQIDFQNKEDMQLNDSNLTKLILPDLKDNKNIANEENKCENKCENLGYTGLKNLYNTCYMNSIIQCLANTEELRDYFLKDLFRKDLNRENPFGSGGRIAESFSDLLKVIWSGEHASISPKDFKTLVDNKLPQFNNYAQHDALEFMEHLLDILHEDINKVDRKNVRITTPPEDDAECPLEEQADKQWKRYKDLNDSLIIDLFYGQYKSKLTCPKCSKVSITFDPFLYLPIPIPQREITYNCYFFYYGCIKPPTKISVKLPHGSKVSSLLMSISIETNIPTAQLIATQVNKYNVLENEFLNMRLLPDKLSKDKKIFVYETPPKDKLLRKFFVHQMIDESLLSLESISKLCNYCDQKIKAIIQNEENNVKQNLILRCLCKEINFYDNHSNRCPIINKYVGWPFVFFIDSNSSFDEFMLNLEKTALQSIDLKKFEKIILSEKIVHQDLPEDLEIKQPKYRFVLKSKLEFSVKMEEIYLPIDDSEKEQLKFNASIEEVYFLYICWKSQVNKFNSDNLDAEWEEPEFSVSTKDLECIYGENENSDIDQEKSECTLEECIKKFTEPETLSIQEAWVCPKCKKPKEAIKELTIWRFPQILIIQLKRFSFNLGVKRKIKDFINFPFEGLDLTEFCTNKNLVDKTKPIYDLYATIRHSGESHGGHFVSRATSTFNQTDLSWRYFNDLMVRSIPDFNLTYNDNDYVLLYRLRKPNN